MHTVAHRDPFAYAYYKNNMSTHVGVYILIYISRLYIYIYIQLKMFCNNAHINRHVYVRMSRLLFDYSRQQNDEIQTEFPQ